MMSNDQIAAEIARIAGKSGEITPERVVEAARDKKSPLHDCFEWDDAKAGHAWRIAQARVLLRGVPMEVKTATATMHVPAYVRDPRMDGGQQGYVSFAKVRSDKDLAREVVVMECQRAAAAMARARQVADALKPHVQVEQIEEITTRLATLSEAAAL